MKIKTIQYQQAVQGWPQKGQHILAHHDNDTIVVYQAYNKWIADYAVKHQEFGGPSFSYNRMSWIKPNFLWMMYRCGWAAKENQEHVLAITIGKTDFEYILEQAVFSSYNAGFYTSQEAWKETLNVKEVRLQWDPDHNPLGEKETRRAIQLGMKGEMLKMFGTQYIRSIEDITGFVKEQKLHVDNNELGKLLVPVETVYRPVSENLCKQVGIDISL